MVSGVWLARDLLGNGAVVGGRLLFALTRGILCCRKGEGGWGVRSAVHRAWCLQASKDVRWSARVAVVGAGGW